ncbi:NADPH oxidase regulator NoxR [Trichophyton violaceum]|uniref:NADPH oxidase regulator NoxR n=1 Tax=Trichophyton violaceum TaxID=34388 RepID=A0A178FI16_TRIVO|nr:NADPH oxidase regulator NoxR [Trichophyton violaceum]
MSLKQQEIETWVQALAHYDNNEFEDAIAVFGGIADTSKILFNCGVIYATLGEHAKAVDCYQRAIALDKYLAIAYFQQGVSNFLIGDFEEALANFNDTLLYLRGNTTIDYEQLGLKYKLYSCEVLFNRGLCYIYLQEIESGMNDLTYAAKEKAKPDHDVIDEAIAETAEGYTVFSIPVGVIYRPSEAKVKNLKTKEYLGKARLVAASDRANTFTGFQGHETKIPVFESSRDDRPPENISYGATNLVQKNLAGRSRQQSEPPISRNAFPPTPPPDEKASSLAPSNGSTGSLTRKQSLTRATRPPVLELGRRASSEQTQSIGGSMAVDSQQPKAQQEKSRVGTVRTASEPRGPASRLSAIRYGPPTNGKLLFRETTGQHRRPMSNISPLSEEPQAYYTMYAAGPGPGYTTENGHTRLPEYINEEGYESEPLDDDAGECIQFEMVGSRPPQHQLSSRHRHSSRRPEIKKIRVKVHADSDTRFIMITPTTEYVEFENKIREKFGFKGNLKIKMQDDGDMVTLADQDDLEMLVTAAKQVARKENNDMGKTEVRVSCIPPAGFAPFA